MRTFKHESLDRPFEIGTMLKHNSLPDMTGILLAYTPCEQPYSSCRECLTSQMELRIQYRGYRGDYYTHSCSTDTTPQPHLRWRAFNG